MAKILYTFTCLIALLSLSQAQQTLREFDYLKVTQQGSADYNATVTVKYWFACARGGLEGLERGLYKKTSWTVDPQCLGTESVEDAIGIYNIFDQGEVASEMGTLFNLLFQLKHEQDAYCQFDDILNDIFRWCDLYDCSLQFMLENILKKVIQITTVATDISNILQDTEDKPPMTDTEYYFNQSENICIGAGKFIRYLTDFDVTKLPQ